MEAFDTHDLYKEFDKAGVPPEQSEVFIKAFKANNKKILKRVEKIEQNVVTKEDIKSLATNEKIDSLALVLTEKIDATNNKVDSLALVITEKINRGNAELKVFVLQYTTGLLIAVAGIVVGILKFLK